MNQNETHKIAMFPLKCADEVRGGFDAKWLTFLEDDDRIECIYFIWKSADFTVSGTEEDLRELADKLNAVLDEIQISDIREKVAKGDL